MLSGSQLCSVRFELDRASFLAHAESLAKVEVEFHWTDGALQAPVIFGDKPPPTLRPLVQKSLQLMLSCDMRLFLACCAFVILLTLASCASAVESRNGAGAAILESPASLTPKTRPSSSLFHSRLDLDSFSDEEVKNAELGATESQGGLAKRHLSRHARLRRYALPPRTQKHPLKPPATSSFDIRWF